MHWSLNKNLDCADSNFRRKTKQIKTQENKTKQNKTMGKKILCSLSNETIQTIRSSSDIAPHNVFFGTKAVYPLQATPALLLIQYNGLNNVQTTCTITVFKKQKLTNMLQAAVPFHQVFTARTVKNRQIKTDKYRDKQNHRAVRAPKTKVQPQAQRAST